MVLAGGGDLPWPWLGDAYLGLGWGVPVYPDRGGGARYLRWGITYLGQGVPTLGRGVPTLAGGYLPWPGDTLAGGTYPRFGGGIPTLDGGYLPWTGGTYLRWGVPTLAGGGGTYLGQVMLRAVRLVRLPAGGLSCSEHENSCQLSME